MFLYYIANFLILNWILYWSSYFSNKGALLYTNDSFLLINIIYFFCLSLFLLIILILIRIIHNFDKQNPKTISKIQNTNKILKKLSLFFLITASLFSGLLYCLSINNKHLTTSYKVSKDNNIYIAGYDKNLFLTKDMVFKVAKRVNSKIAPENKKIWWFYINILSEKEELLTLFETEESKERILNLILVWGNYSSLTDTININPIQTTLWFGIDRQKIVIAHEIWHWFWFNKVKEEEQKEWIQLFNKSFYKNNERFLFWLNENFLTEYSKTNYAEDFAEFFALYIYEQDFIINKLNIQKTNNENSELKDKYNFIKKVLN